MAPTRSPLAAPVAVSDAQVPETGVESVGTVNDVDPSLSAVDVKRQKSDFRRMQEHLAGQKKVRVRVQEDTWVQLNGYTFQIKGKTWVEVPAQVAEILEEANRI